MPYDSDNDPYLISGTEVLKNKLSITDQAKLEASETVVSASKIASLEEHPVPGNFDLDHLCAIHHEIFGDIYDWAGHIRTVNISKGATQFAMVDVIMSYATSIFGPLHRENLLRGLSDAKYATRLAHYYSEVNLLHPFREGNGRTQRAFFTLLALQDGKRIAWDKLDAEANTVASIKAHQTMDESDLVELLRPLIQLKRTH